MTDISLGIARNNMEKTTIIITPEADDENNVTTYQGIDNEETITNQQNLDNVPIIMNANAALPFKDVTDLSRDEKRETWMKRTGHTVKVLASVVGVVPSVLSRYLASDEMPLVHHNALVAYGVPAEVLLAPVQKTRGRPPVTPIHSAQPR